MTSDEGGPVDDPLVQLETALKSSLPTLLASRDERLAEVLQGMTVASGKEAEVDAASEEMEAFGNQIETTLRSCRLFLQNLRQDLSSGSGGHTEDVKVWENRAKEKAAHAARVELELGMERKRRCAAEARMVELRETIDGLQYSLSSIGKGCSDSGVYKPLLASPAQVLSASGAGSPAASAPTLPTRPKSASVLSSNSRLSSAAKPKAKGVPKMKALPPSAVATASSQQQALARLRNVITPSCTGFSLLVEHCHSCDKHDASSRHVEARYLQTAAAVAEAAQKVLRPWDVGVATLPTRGRLGAMEVTLSWRCRGIEHAEVIHSKLRGEGWPGAAVVDKLAGVLQESLPLHSDQDLVQEGVGELDS